MTEEKQKQELLRVLEGELLLHKELLVILEQEKGALAGRNPRSLMPVTEKKELLIEEIKRRERERSRLIFDIAGYLNLNTKELTLTLLAEAWSEPRFLRLKEEFKSVLEKIKDKQQINSSLIRQGMELIDFCLATLTPLAADPLYDAKGNIKENRAPYRSHLDGQI